MRIITGSAKGVTLKTVKGFDVRPTSDRVKESIFNILENISLCADNPDGNNCRQVIEKAKVLDLFAGTGNLGLEALSRGAEYAVFVDKSPVNLSVIKENIQAARMAQMCEIIKSDAFLALDKLKKAGKTFRLVFIDPPYNLGLPLKVIDKIDNFKKNSFLEPGGILIVEHSSQEAINFPWKNLRILRSQKYGQTIVSFLIHNT